MNEENNLNQENSADQQVKPDQPTPASQAVPDATQVQPPVQPTQPNQSAEPVQPTQPNQTYQTPVQSPDQTQTYPAYGTQPVNYSQQGGYYAQPAPPAQPSSGKAMAALVCGILAIFFSETVLIGIVLGIVAIVLAGQYVKSFGKDSKATGGKITGIIGIVFSVLALISYIAIGIFAASFYDSGYEYYDDYDYEYIYPDDDDNYDNESGGISGYGDLVDEAEAVQEFDKVMEQIKAFSDNEVLAKIADEFNNDLEDWYGITLEDMGIDPKEIIEISLYRATYELESYSSYSYSSSDTLSLDGYVSCADSLDILLEFSDKISDKGIYSDDVVNQDKAMIKDLYLEAAKEATPSYDTYIWVEVARSGAGEWVVDPESFEDAIYMLFSIY